MTETIWEYRASELVDVSFPKRQIELIVMPYEQEALVPYGGRVVTEICSRGAYDGIEARNGRVRVNRDHDVARTVGRTVTFHPSRKEGLVAEVRISRTDLGEETLELAGDGVLDASAGFRLMLDQAGRVVPNAETWETRNRRRLNKLFLGHIALTPEPAYESANVLAVRQAEPVTVGGSPNREKLRMLELQETYARIDAKYLSA